MDRFEENEMILMAMFQRETRRQTMEDISAIIPFIAEDEEMILLVNQTLEKMRDLSDDDYLNLDLEEYQEETAEDE